jgi:hypothetical protein
MVVELEIKKLREEFKSQLDDLRKLIMGRNIVGNWVKQPIACAMIDVQPRQLRNLRIHVDASGKRSGSIRWRKGKGKTREYHKADLEAYLNEITVS